MLYTDKQKKDISGISTRIPDYLSSYHESATYRDMFFSAVSKLHVNLSGYFVEEDCFRSAMNGSCIWS